MATLNKKTEKRMSEARLAGGMGMKAAVQDAEALLRRASLACLLWENLAYENGSDVAKNICELIPQVAPEKVADLAVEARFTQKLRHLPLLIVAEMAKHETHKPFVAETLAKIIHRADELTEFLSIYWRNGKTPLSAQVKKGLAKAFGKFDEYGLAKYNRAKDIKLLDVMRLVHPVPKDAEQAALWGRLKSDSLATPDTWEVALSKCHTIQEKKACWERLLTENKLGALALLRNLRNMNQADVKPSLIRNALKTANAGMMLPMNFFAAAKHAPDYIREIEDMMLRSCTEMPKLTGHTILVVDVSGSMGACLSGKSEFNRMQAAMSMAVIAAEMCESVTIYATAGSDSGGTHKTAKVKANRGFALVEQIENMKYNLGGGGIFTRQCLEYIKSETKEKPDRIIVFSDSQDCDRRNKIPSPFGVKNYIVDVSAHRHGINYAGIWTSEISGWSENFLRYIAAYESN
jgi:60 kDa SS-A/Ro ribonucleoprotein